jgi:hypothetical protein
MPKINTYDSDDIHPEDRVIGTEGDPYGDLGSTKNHKVDTLYIYTKQRLIDEGFSGGGTGKDALQYYRSDFTSPYIYAGYILNTVHTITRALDGVVETAAGVTNLETDWTNRLTLTYS